MSAPYSTSPGIIVERTKGLVEFEEANHRMRLEVAGIRAGTARERLWLLEHPPLYSAGTSARAPDLIDPQRFPVVRSGRGGQWTYHGPGQRIAYVMLDLTNPHGTVAARDLHSYVEGLEGWLIAALAKLGMAGERRRGRVGIWVADPQSGREDKIAALGVRITRWVSWHGVAINVSPNLEHFAGIVPCGIHAHGVTSLDAMGSSHGMNDLDEALLAAWPQVFGGLPPAASRSP